MSPDALSVTLRALAFFALFQAVGATLFLALFARRLNAARAAVRRLALAAAACAALFTLAHHGLEAARMAGDYSGLWDSDLQQLAWWSRSGQAPITEVVGLLILLASLWWLPVRTALPGASAGGVLVLCGFLLTGHTSAHAWRAVLAPLLGLHLLIVAFWFGALWPLLVVVRLEAASIAAQIVARYSTLAGYLVPLIAVAGLTMAWILTGERTILRQPYGKLLAFKLVLFVLLMAPAAYNRWRLVPALTAATAGAGTALRRSIAMEFLLIAIALTVTAALTTLYSPHGPADSQALAAQMAAATAA